MTLNKFLSRFSQFFLIIFLSSAFYISGCSDDPTDLGLNFLDPDDTTGVRSLDSQTDTILITSTNYKYFINTFGSRGILIGRFQNPSGVTEADAMIKFKEISDQYAGVTVNSAKLRLTTRGYSYHDKNGTTAFDIFRVNKNFGYSTVTKDSVTPADIGTTVLGSFSGMIMDTTTIEMTLDNQTVKDWLEFAADPNYATPNYGIYFRASGISSTIKSFFSFAEVEEHVPTVEIVITKNNVSDTIFLRNSDYVSLSDAPIPSIDERFVIQNGIAIRNMLRFDLSKLPDNVIINQATFEFFIDRSQSFITTDSEMRMQISLMTDTLTKTDSLIGNTLNDAFIQEDSTKFVSNINNLIQRWNSGVSPNYGLSIRNVSEIHNLDRFVFYNVNSSDISKRPRIKIIYTRRN
jgi:hypothetical protein